MPRLFGTDGIRGVVGQWPMTPEFVLQLGQASGRVIRDAKREATVVIGRDTRQSSAMLQEALDAGLMASGVHVIDLGVVPTPGVSWLVMNLNADAGVVISASHNPADQNGIKFFSGDGRKLSEAMEDQIETLLPQAAGQPVPQPFDVHAHMGHVHNGEIFQELYQRSLLGEHPDLKVDGLKVIVDCANGAASNIAPEVFSRLGLDVVAIHASPNGLNINVDAGSEHVRRSTEEMRLLIEHHKAHFGLAFDGDADRVVFVDHLGTLIDGDHMLGLLARYFRERGRLLGNAIVTTVMRNTGLKNRLESAGITMYETPVGDKYVTDKIFELRQAGGAGQVGIGGEQAGHILIVDNDHPTGDGLRTALYIIRTYIESGVASLAEFAAGVGKTPQIIASAYVGRGPRLDKAALAELEAATLAGCPGLVRANLRYSGTEPRFRAMLESDGALDEADLADVAVEICRRLQAHAGVGKAEIDILNATRGGVIEVE